jgi:MFS family permease
MGSAAMIGPILGGALIALNLFGSGWRLVFLINLPLGIAAVIGAALLLPVTRTRQASNLDIGGAALAAVAALAIVYPLIQGRELGWPAWTYASMGASIVLFALLALHLRRRKAAGLDPLIEPSIFSHRGYTAGALVLMLYFGGMVGSMLALTLFVQLGEGFSAIHAGLTVAPFALGTAITAPVAAQMMTRIGGRVLIQIGGFVSLLGYVAVALIVASAGHASTWTLAGPLLVVGLGMGLFVVPVFDTIISAVTDQETGSASGVLNAIQQLGGGIGVAVLGTIFFTVLGHEGFAPALTHTMWWQVVTLAVMLALSPLLPARAREPQAAAVDAEPRGARQERLADQVAA